MKEVKIGKFKICIAERDGSHVVVCAECGMPLTMKHLRDSIFSAETGYLYCSQECAVEDIDECILELEAK